MKNFNNLEPYDSPIKEIVIRGKSILLGTSLDKYLINGYVKALIVYEDGLRMWAILHKNRRGKYSFKMEKYENT